MVEALLEGGGGGSYRNDANGSENLTKQIQNAVIIGIIISNSQSSGSSGGTPTIKYPGKDPSVSPREGWEWRGNGEPKSGKGSWYNPSTGESLHPDLQHSAPVRPHWDYTASEGTQYRVNPDGTIVPK